MAAPPRLDASTEPRLYDLVLRDATIVTPQGRQVADVAITKGRIAYVGPRPPRRARQEIKAIGKFLMPGVIDTAVQFDPLADDTTWSRESRAALTGGVTTVLCLPDGKAPVVDAASAQARADRIQGHSYCHYGLWAGATNANARAVDEAVRAGLIVGTLARVGVAGDRVGLDAEHLGSHMAVSEGVLGVQAFDDEQPAVVVDAVRRTERPVHMVHLSTANELHLIDPVRGSLPVTAGVTPHHLFLSREVLNGHADLVATVPPVRPEHDRRTLWTAMKRGRVDCLASDHHPWAPGRGEAGVPGSELLFPLMLSAVKHGRLSLEMLVSLCSESPARIFGLETKGRVARGCDADLVLFTEGDLCRVAEDDLLSGAGWSPYVDREAAPKPEMVIVGGNIVAQRGKLVDETPYGTCVTDRAA